MNILFRGLDQLPLEGLVQVLKGATDTGNDGMAYRVYACGIRAGEGIDPIVVPLERW